MTKPIRITPGFFSVEGVVIAPVDFGCDAVSVELLADDGRLGVEVAIEPMP